MLQSAWLLIGAVSVIATGVAVSCKTKGAALWPNDDAVAIMSGIIGFVSWGMFAFGSLDVRVVGDAVTYSFTMPAVTFWAVMMSLVPMYIALTGPVSVISRARSPKAEEL